MADDTVTISLICDGSSKSKDKLKELVDHLTLPEEPVEVVISYKIKKLFPDRSR